MVRCLGLRRTRMLCSVTRASRVLCLCVWARERTTAKASSGDMISTNRHRRHTQPTIPHTPALPPSSGILFPCCFPCSYPSVRRLSCPFVLSLSECLVFVCLCPSLHPCIPPLWSCFSPCSSPSESSCVLLSTCIVYVCISLFATPCCLPNKCCIHAGSTPPLRVSSPVCLGEKRVYVGGGGMPSSPASPSSPQSSLAEPCIACMSWVHIP